MDELLKIAKENNKLLKSIYKELQHQYSTEMKAKSAATNLALNFIANYVGDNIVFKDKL